ncbi:MAG: vacuolar H+transporting two-sector ATPase F subunit [Thaumarchaeota archaeon]|nr:vacuolar H+transporting two-sector ATPase F subunit [Nitrososphaerota archaeon]
MKIVAIGGRSFVSGFMLAGIEGVEVVDSKQVLGDVKRLMMNREVALILVSDALSKEIRDELTDIRSKNPVPLIYEIPAPGSKQEKVEYRELIKKVLKVG